MEIDRKNNYILIGLPQSGKSTYIAALWHIVESGELSDSLIITGLPDDSEYLNKLRDTWLSYKDFERTIVDSKHEITLEVSSNSNDIVSELKFPDVSGEMYRIQFEDRKLDLEYLEMIQSANGIILFINPDFIKEPQLISDIDACIGDEKSPSSAENEKRWEFKDVPTQVILVDLLQMISFNIEQQIKVAIIVSAWDQIISQNVKPPKWVDNTLPLLYQFLSANESIFKVDFFGISAQGGNYKEHKDELQAKSPSERIIVETNHGTSNDITLPVKWLLKNE